MQKRGCVLHPIYFHSFPYTGDRTRAKVMDLAAVLRPAQARMSLQVVPFTKVQTAIRDHCPTDLAVVLYRRMMMRISTALAERAGCAALATGENLGQVASQTLDNLACIEQCAGLPVLRPLLTYDKAETIALARTIDTYELSIAPYEDCCSLFVPKHPATRAKPEAAARAEEALDLEDLVTAAVEGTESVEVE
jgi:thiamine biosynthesis protein ThiI